MNKIIQFLIAFGIVSFAIILIFDE